MTEPKAFLCFGLILMIPLAAAGLATMNSGLGRARSAAHSVLSALCAAAAAALAYAAIGFVLQGYPGLPAHGFMLGGKYWMWAGAGHWLLGGLDFDGSALSLVALFGIFGAALAAIIPTGSGDDRWHLGACCASSALLGAITFPLFAHWSWGGGWLAQLGENRGLGRGFLDCGGSATIQAVGGLTALAVTWILKPRLGKFNQQGMPAAIPGHNAVVVLLGCFLAWFGWMGLNGAGSLLFGAAEPGRLPLVALNTSLAAMASLLAAVAMTRTRFGKVDATLCSNGWVGGLVASSAGCAWVSPIAMIFMGAAAGVLVLLSIEYLELRLSVDDPSGAVSVHAVSGIWGVLAAGVFARFPGADVQGQWLAQVVGIATLIGFVLPLAYGLNWLLNRFYPQRVSAEAERMGLDLYELGANAYPDFVTHNEDPWQH